MPSPEIPLRRTSLSKVGFRTPDVQAMITFYARTMGLVVDAQASSPDAVSLGWGHGQPVLELLHGPAGLDHIALEVEDSGGQEALGARLQARGVAVSALGDALESLEVRDPDGNRVRLHGPIDRRGEHTADPGRRPLRLQHATFATGAMEAMIDFYVGLGFTVTDRMGDVFTWLRSNVEHHSVAVVDVGRSDGLDHYSYDLATWEDFKVWADRLTDRGIPVQWGPGRHGPGNNLFLFVDDPDGNHVELSAEMERYLDDRVSYEPRLWEAAPTTVNLWGGQVPLWRQTN